MPHLKRILRNTALTALALPLLAFALVQFQQHLFQHRAAALMADMQAIRLHQTTWPEAQALMHRWGRWSHYEGTCTVASCRDMISIPDPATHIYHHLSPTSWTHIPPEKIYSLYQFFGGKFAELHLAFIVQDGFIVRKGIYLNLSVPPTKDDSFGYSLLITAVSIQHINPDLHEMEEHFSQDPYYTAQRPGGCEICMQATLGYSDLTPQAEVQRLTAFNLSCLSWPAHCKTVEDVLPALEPFHLYKPYYASSTPPPPKPMRPCDIPLWARGRDASNVIVADTLRTRVQPPNPQFGGGPTTYADIRVTGHLKGSKNASPGTQLTVTPWTSDPYDPGESSESMTPGSRYILFDYTYRRDYPSIRIDRCSVVPDTPENRTEVQKGIDLNDHLRQPELTHWPLP